MRKILSKTILKRELHPDDVENYEFISDLAEKLAKKFDLKFTNVTPISVEFLWGLCDHLRGFIYINFRFPKADWGVERKELVKILCHELAHLKILGHSEEFFKFCNEIIDAANEITGLKVKHEQFISRESLTYGY